jgi:Uncharacterized protein conserved in bacteria C-term(DUF2220)
MNETQRRFLRCLRDAQPGGMRRSSVPKTCLTLVESLQTCGAVEFRPASSGRGLALLIIDQMAFRSFVGARIPGGLDVDVDSILDRATAVQQLADAKAIRRAAGQGIFVRATKPGVLVHSVDGESPINVTQLTSQSGCAGFLLPIFRGWTFVGDIAVVENADAFWKHEVALPEVDLAILANGLMSTRLISWLSSPQMARCRITHWGDYDPIGVCEYLRIARQCPGRVCTYAPPEVDRLLARCGKRRLVTRQPTFLKRLRSSVADPHVRRMTDLFDKHRRGLEQEALLLPWSDVVPNH